MNYKSYSDLVKDSYLLAQKLGRNDYNAIISIPRSGNIPSSIVALTHNLPWLTVFSLRGSQGDSSFTGRINGGVSFPKTGRYLVVDDSCSSGSRILKAKKDLRDAGYLNVDFAAIYVTGTSKDIVDTWVEVVAQPRVFEWNIYHHTYVGMAGFDIDGVVCPDPPPGIDEVAHEKGYIDWIRSAPVLHPISMKINCFITSRLEKYRKETEEWLAKNQFSYGELIMSPHKTAIDRRKAQDHGQQKAKVFKERADLKLFVESNRYQAEIISQLTRKPVFCVDQNKMY
jgi:uncharacterized HAD superfamily protein